MHAHAPSSPIVPFVAIAANENGKEDDDNSPDDAGENDEDNDKHARRSLHAERKIESRQVEEL